MAKLLTVEAVAELVGLSTTWVYRRVERGEIPHLKLGRAVRFDLDELQAWLKNRSGNSSSSPVPAE